jgi:recombinational DNA repair ATPase RecF
MLREALRKQAFEAIRDDPQLAQLAERIARARNRILLMLNPAKDEHDKLCTAIDHADRLLLESEATLAQMNDRVEAITRAGRTVLRAEWARVKRGD